MAVRWYQNAAAQNPQQINYGGLKKWYQGVGTARQEAKDIAVEERNAFDEAKVTQNRILSRLVSEHKTKQFLESREAQMAEQMWEQEQRQAQWDAQAEADQLWGKWGEEARANLSKSVNLLGLSDYDRERMIAEETYKIASEYATQTGDYEAAKEAMRRADIAGGRVQAEVDDYGNFMRPVMPGDMGTEQESKWKDVRDNLWVSVVDTTRMAAQTYLQDLPTYFITGADRLKKAMAGASESQKKMLLQHGIVADELKDKVGVLNPTERAALKAFGEAGQKIQDDFDNWYMGHPELWERPEWAGPPSEVSDEVKKDPMYWVSKAVQNVPYMVGAAMGGTVGIVSGNPFLGVAASAPFIFPAVNREAKEAALRAGMNEIDATELGVLIGTANTALELVGEFPLVLTFSGLRNVFRKKAAEEMVAEVLKRMALKSKGKEAVKRVLQTMTAEELTEVSQQATLNAALKTFDDTISIMDGMTDTVQLTFATVLPMALLGMGGSMANVRQYNATAKYNNEIIDKYEEMLERDRQSEESHAKEAALEMAATVLEQVRQDNITRTREESQKLERQILANIESLRGAAEAAEQLRRANMEAGAEQVRGQMAGNYGQGVSEGYGAVPSEEPSGGFTPGMPEGAARVPPNEPPGGGAAGMGQGFAIGTEEAARAAEAAQPTEQAPTVEKQGTQAKPVDYWDANLEQHPLRVNGADSDVGAVMSLSIEAAGDILRSEGHLSGKDYAMGKVKKIESALKETTLWDKSQELTEREAADVEETRRLLEGLPETTDVARASKRIIEGLLDRDKSKVAAWISTARDALEAFYTAQEAKERSTQATPAQQQAEAWETSDLAGNPNISIDRVEAKKLGANSFALYFRGTRNEVFAGERFKTATEARQFFKAQQAKARQSQAPAVEIQAAPATENLASHDALEDYEGKTADTLESVDEALAQEVAQAAENRKKARSVSLQGNIVTELAEPNESFPQEKIGRKTRAADPENQIYQMQYAVIELDDLIASNNADFSVNKAFPEELQPRDRSRASLVDQVNGIVAGFTPFRVLGENPNVGDGSPIVGGDKIVESGNGRIIAFRIMRKAESADWRDYQNELRDNIETYGLTQETLAGMKSPVLVRLHNVVKGRPRFCWIANKEIQMRPSRYETAKADARMISSDAITYLDVGEDEDIDSALRKQTNYRLMEEFLGNMTKNERGSVANSEGGLTMDAYDRLKWAMFAKVYGSGKQGAMLMEGFAEGADDEHKAVRTALFQALPQMSKAMSLVDNGILSQQYAVIPQTLAKIFSVYGRVKRSRMTVTQYLNQSTFIEELNEYEKGILKDIDELAGKSKHPKQVRIFLQQIANQMLEQRQLGQKVISEELVDKQATTKEIIDNGIEAAKDKKAAAAAAAAAKLEAKRAAESQSLPGMEEEIRGGMEGGEGPSEGGPQQDLFGQSGTNIGGGTAYDPTDVGNIGSYPSEEQATRARTGNVAEQRLLRRVQKNRLGKWVVKLISKVDVTRETLDADYVKDVIANALYASKKHANSTVVLYKSLLEEIIPNIKEHWGFTDEDGTATRVRRKAEYPDASLDVHDIMEEPWKYELDEASMKFILLKDQIVHAMVEMMKANGVELEENWFVEQYMPRMVKSVEGFDLYPRVDFNQPRVFSKAAEGREHEVKYINDPIGTLASFIQEAYLAVGTKRISDAVKEVGAKPSSLIPPSIVYAREYAVKMYQRAVRAETAVQRVRRGERLHPSTLGSIRALSPEIADGIVELERLTGKARTLKAAELIVDIRDIKAQRKAMAEAARADYKKAKAIAARPRPWRDDNTQAKWRNTFISSEVRQVLEDFGVASPEKQLPSDFLKGTAEINDALRTAVAAMDFSSLMIQNLLLLGRPKTFAKVMAKSFQVFFNRDVQRTYFQQDDVRRTIEKHRDIRIGITHEYVMGLHAIEHMARFVGRKLGNEQAGAKVGQFLVKPLKPFERFFGFSGDMARVEMARVMEPVFVKNGMADQLGTYVNRMTGVMNTEALGISAKQRAAERLLMFAPQYTRACLAYIQYVHQNNVMGSQARQSFVRLFGVGTAMYVASCAALGQEPDFDPRSPSFFTVKVGNRHLGVGGFQYSFLRFIADSFQSAAGTDGNEPMDFLNFTDRKENPILKWLYSRSSPMVSLTTEGITQRDYLGYPLDDMESWAYWLFVEHMIPIAAQEQFPGPNEEPPTRRGIVGAAEWLGMRTFPVNEFYELANEYAQEAYGKDWNDLWRPTKGGTYVKSNEMTRLLNTHPDLKEAYDKWKPLQTKRWQAEHGLLPDDDAVNDYYAWLLLNKPWDSLSRSDKKKVKQYREFAEEAEEAGVTLSGTTRASGGGTTTPGLKIPGLS